jgi:hypothetical protein
MNLDSFLRGYVTCALWSSTDDEGEALDAAYDDTDIAPETLAGMREDCTDFIASNRADLEAYARMRNRQPGTGHSVADCAGHDFWLTRNRHGAGFWDRGLAALGERLSEAAKVYGSVDLYVGDDGKIHGG